MTRAKQPIPFAAGCRRSGTDRRGRRIGTAPLRRYIDGLAQRQALSALCGYGVPLTVDECREASKTAARASDNSNNNNIQSSKRSHNMLPRSRRQVSALYELARHLESTGGIQNRRQVKAVSTGHNNEVVIIGVGATGRCKGVRGTLKSGERLLVQVDRLSNCLIKFLICCLLSLYNNNVYAKMVKQRTKICTGRVLRQRSPRTCSVTCEDTTALQRCSDGCSHWTTALQRCAAAANA